MSRFSYLMVPLAALLLAACQPSGDSAVLPAASTAVRSNSPVQSTQPVAEPRAAPAAPAAPPEAQDTVVRRFRANGFSPAWQAEIDGSKLRFEVPDMGQPDPRLREIPVERLAYAKGVNFDGRDGQVEVSLDINGKPCQRTGAEREFTATLRYGKSTYHGCADRAP